MEFSRGAIRSEINVTPLVDVCLVLLIIFMVVVPILHAGVPVDLPKTVNGHSLSESNQISVTVAADGGVYVRSARVSSADLPALLAQIHAAEPDRDVVVRGDRHLQYETMCEVLTAVSQAGFAHVGLVTERAKAAG
ncbi:MAG: biopolymer transporter ExbD [Thermoanaerobaculia bacterium]